MVRWTCCLVSDCENHLTYNLLRSKGERILWHTKCAHLTYTAHRIVITPVFFYYFVVKRCVITSLLILVHIYCTTKTKKRCKLQFNFEHMKWFVVERCKQSMHFYLNPSNEWVSFRKLKSIFTRRHSNCVIFFFDFAANCKTRKKFKNHESLWCNHFGNGMCVLYENT